jgi:ankyrin repeat protein
MTNQSGKTALMLAALFGHEEVAKLLLSRGANPEIADKQGNTAMSLAKAQGNQAMVQLLKQALIAEK